MASTTMVGRYCNCTVGVSPLSINLLLLIGMLNGYFNCGDGIPYLIVPHCKIYLICKPN